MAVNLAEKYSKLIDERFKLASITDRFAGKKYDWDGVKTVNVYSVDPVTLGNYTRSGTTRFGTVTELGDAVKAYVVNDDKSFTFSIDAGNAAEQFNIKQCNAQLKSNWDEVCTPYIDKYRFDKWINYAGIVQNDGGTALTKSTVIEAIMTAGAAQSNALVPKANRAIFVSESLYIKTKLATEVVGIDTLGEKSVKNGIVGYLDGAAVVTVPDSYFPTGVEFMIKWKDATADPMKLKTLRVQHNPLGIDGDVGECRFLHDAFVLANKANGIAVFVKSANVAVTPTIAVASGTVTLTSSGATAMYYTTDGSDPKFYGTLYNGSSKPTGLTEGMVVRAYAEKTGAVNSGIASHTVLGTED